MNILLMNKSQHSTFVLTFFGKVLMNKKNYSKYSVLNLPSAISENFGNICYLASPLKFYGILVNDFPKRIWVAFSVLCIIF